MNGETSTSKPSPILSIDTMYSWLDTCQGFIPSETVEGAGDLYLFSVDRKHKEFVFILRDRTIYRLAYGRLVSYTVRTKNNSTIIIDLKTRDYRWPFIYIECFDKMRANTELSGRQRSMSEVDSLYEEELENVEEIKGILEEIMAENQKAFNMLPSSDPQKHEIIITIPAEEPAQPNVSDIVQAVKEYKEKHPVTEIEAEAPIIIDPFIEPEEAPLPEIEYEPFFEELKSEDVETEDEVKVSPDKNEISLDEIENYSRGKFLDSDLRSAISDAKMKGQKYIFITDEQLEKLKE